MGACRVVAASAAGLLLGFAACDMVLRLIAGPKHQVVAQAGARSRIHQAHKHSAPLPVGAAPLGRRPAAAVPDPRRRRKASRSKASWSPVACPTNCSSHGVCNLDTGECLCELGYAGDDCEQRDEFSCDIPEGDELVSRCAGACDDTALKCFCGGGRHPRRPMFQCEFKGVGKWMPWKGEGWNHARVAQSPRDFWSSAADAPAYLASHPAWKKPADARMVPWCDADPGSMRGRRLAAGCNCHEGTEGSLCELPVLMACLNQCSARGVCHHGFCRCDEGWYGVDCSLSRGTVQPLRLKGAAPPPPPPPPPPPEASGAASAVAQPALRPLIYVYELPPRFNTEMWSTKTEKRDCTTRAYSASNGTRWHMHAFGMEVAVLESLLASPHRTNDPDAADFFYVPVWAGCFLSRFSRPTPRHFDLTHLMRNYPIIKVPRAARASQLVRDALGHLSSRWPYWNRSGGADHLWAFPHDEGACLAPAEIRRSIFVTHWGRLQPRPPNHTTISAGQGWRVPPWHLRMMGGVAQCYQPGKDVLLPIFKSRQFVLSSPFLTGVQRRRPVLFSFLGNAQNQPPQYAFGLRKQLWALHSGRKDACMPARCAQHNAGCRLDFEQMPDRCVLIGGHTRDFIQVLQRSIFCAVLPGNGWGHIEEPAIHGCIPVVIMPGIHAQLDDALDFSRFALRLERHELPMLIDRLRAFSAAELRRMQAELRTVWERFTYSGLFKREYQLQLAASHAPKPARARLVARLGTSALEDQRVFGPVEPRLTGVDAVATLLDVLRLRLRARAQADPPGPRFVDHGPPARQPEPIQGYRLTDTSGVQ